MSLLCVSKKAFILTWKIENSLFTVDACLESPTFLAQNLANTKWSLKLIVKIVNGIPQLFCILKRDYEDEGPTAVGIHFKIRLDKKYYPCDCIFSRGMSQSAVLFNNMGLLKEDFLTKGPWTIQCKISMWDDGSQSSEIRCIARTRTLITNFSRIRKFSWLNSKLTEDMVVNLNSNSADERTFTVALRLNISVRNEVTVKIKNLTSRNVFLSGRISVRNNKGDFLYSAQGSVIFRNYGNEWDFPLVFSKEMAKRILGKLKAYVHRSIKLKNAESQTNDLICASKLLCNNFTSVQTIRSGYRRMLYTKFSQTEGPLKSNDNRYFKSTNEVSQTADLTCASKLVWNNDTLLQTTNTDYRRMLGDHFSSTVGKISMDVQSTKFSSKANAGMQTSKIYCKDSTSETAYSYYVRNIGIQVSSDFKDVCVQTPKPEKNIHISSDYKTNKGIQTSQISCKNATSQTSYSDCARNIGIRGSVVSDFKDVCVQTSIPERNIPTTEFDWESNIGKNCAYPNYLKRLKIRERNPFNVRFNKRYIFKPYSKNLDIESPKSKVTKFLMTAPTYSKDFNITPLILAEDQLKRLRSFDCTILRSEPGNECCKEMVISNNITKNNAVENLSNNNESNDLLNKDGSIESRGFPDEDSSNLQIFHHQINSDIWQDYSDVISYNSFVLNNRRFLFILSVTVLCLSLAFGCYFSITNSSEVQEQILVFNSSIYVKSGTFKATFQINITETECDNRKIIVDLDPETLDNFLGFVFSKEMENLQWEKVINLLHIANKHHIGLLQTRCTSFLESRLSVSNVCEILLIADAYNDVVLKKAAQDFVCFFADEVFASNEWQNFILYNTQLAAETVNYFLSFKRDKYVT
ncbi:hypothetical protein AVEN_161841-1 [Araneus ventricosus]|uniref:BTB domain-containing protein n=1 Tax=Araneus ventricosus TaxID=182803 RepID=A0A4Y2JRG8_ARAVE|nr:hypothetical protein AVEN_161841-1 [Araneus ventricosus]